LKNLTTGVNFIRISPQSQNVTRKSCRNDVCTKHLYVKCWWIWLQVGFNSGLDDQANCTISSSCFVVEGSRTEEILNVSRLSNVGIPGKWIFRVDQEHVEEGGCNTGGFLIFSPNNVNFLGGEEVLLLLNPVSASVPKS